MGFPAKPVTRCAPVLCPRVAGTARLLGTPTHLRAMGGRSCASCQNTGDEAPFQRLKEPLSLYLRSSGTAEAEVAKRPPPTMPPGSPPALPRLRPTRLVLATAVIGCAAALFPPPAAPTATERVTGSGVGGAPAAGGSGEVLRSGSLSVAVAYGTGQYTVSVGKAAWLTSTSAGGSCCLPLRARLPPARPRPAPVVCATPTSSTLPPHPTTPPPRKQPCAHASRPCRGVILACG